MQKIFNLLQPLYIRQIHNNSGSKYTHMKQTTINSVINTEKKIKTVMEDLGEKTDVKI